MMFVSIRNRFHSLDAAKNLFLRAKTNLAVWAFLTALLPCAAHAQSIPMIASVDLGQQVRAIAPAPTAPNEWYLYAGSNRVLLGRMNAIFQGAINFDILESVRVDQVLTLANGLAYHAGSDTFFITTQDGQVRRHKRNPDSILATVGVTQIPGALVDPPVPGTLIPRGISALADGRLVVVTDQHIVYLDSNGLFLSSAALDTNSGPVPPLGIDVNLGNGRLGIMKAGTNEFHSYSGDGSQTIASMPVLGGPSQFTENADFVWDPVTGNVLVTEFNQNQNPDLYVFSLTADPKRWTVRNTRNSGQGSLRQILEDANKNIVADVINFASDLFPRFVRIRTELPILEEGFTTIDGDSNSDGIPDIAIFPAESPTPLRGLCIRSHGNTIRRLGFLGIGSSGVSIRNGDRNRIETCYLGVSLDGAAVSRSGQHGIHLIAGAEDNVIADCTISGWHNDGIRIEDRCHRTVVQGNKIGTDSVGLDSIGNGRVGINIIRTRGVRIGGSLPGQGNLISRNDREGILIERGNAPEPSTDIDIQGNLIGTDFTGSNPLPNGSDGIRIRECPGIRIGGLAPEEANKILFNEGTGILVWGQDTASIFTRGNVLFRNRFTGIFRFRGAELHVSPPVLGQPGTFIIGGRFTTIIGFGIAGAEAEVYRTGRPTNGNGPDGAQFLGRALIDSIGIFNVTVPGPLILGETITALQTDPILGSSEFSLYETVPDLPEFSVRSGSVNSGAGPITDVLRVNGSVGDASRNLFLRVGEAITATLDGPPSRQGMRSPFVLYVWRGSITPLGLTPVPMGVGTLAFPGPFNPGASPQPVFILNNLGFPEVLGLPSAASIGAPTALRTLAQGVSRPSTWVLQGIIRDEATESGVRAALTNAIEINIRQ